MKQISEWKRARQTGKGGKAQHLGVEHWIIDSPEFKALKGGPLRVLIHLGRQYNGYNNGNFYITPLRAHINKATTQKALTALQETGWLVKTRHGGMRMGCDLFAITWWPIDDCKGKHSCDAETTPSHTWMKKRRFCNPELAVQESRTSEAQICIKNPPVVQESRTKNPNFRAA